MLELHQCQRSAVGEVQGMGEVGWVSPNAGVRTLNMSSNSHFGESLFYSQPTAVTSKDHPNPHLLAVKT